MGACVTLLLFFLFAALFLFVPAPGISGVKEGLFLCANTLLPSVFPFLVLSALFVKSNLADRLSRAASRFLRPFRLSEEACTPYLLSLLGGYPCGASALASLSSRGKIKREEAVRLLPVCSHPSAAFVFGFLGHAVFHSTKLALLLFLIQILSGLILCRLYSPKPDGVPAKQSESVTVPHVSAAFSDSVKEAGAQAMQLCMFVTFFRVLQSYLAVYLFPHLPPIVSVLLAGILELTTGISSLQSASLPTGISLMAVSFFLSFGGLCVQMQVCSILEEDTLSLMHYPRLLFRKGLLSAALAVPVSFFCPSLTQTASFSGFSSFSRIPSGFRFLILCFFCVFFRIRGRNSAQQRV